LATSLAPWVLSRNCARNDASVFPSASSRPSELLYLQNTTALRASASVAMQWLAVTNNGRRLLLRSFNRVPVQVAHVPLSFCSRTHPTESDDACHVGNWLALE